MLALVLLGFVFFGLFSSLLLTRLMLLKYLGVVVLQWCSRRGDVGAWCEAASLRSLPCISNSERKSVVASLAAEVLTVGAWEQVPRAGSLYTWPGSYIFPLAFAPGLRDTWPGWEQLGFGSSCPQTRSRVPWSLALPVAKLCNQHLSP